MFLATDTIVDSKFVVRSVIGCGGMGVVYEAYQQPLARSVALKTLINIGSDRDEDFARFQREASVISKLNHPNIVQFIAYGIWAKMPYLAMERLNGRSLQQMLQNNEPLAVDVALTIIEQLCAGVAHAHEHNVVHRDIKPTNIFVIDTEDEPMKVKVIDFGLAKIIDLDSGQRLTRTGVGLGSLLYLSPEQCTGEKVDFRTDIYAIGTVLYHCLTGEPPFRADNAPAVIFQQINEPIAHAPKWNALTEPFQQVVAKCMAKDKQDRYSCIAALSEDIDRIKDGRAPLLDGEPVDSTKGGHTLSAKNFRQRRKWCTSIIAVAAGLSICGFVIVTYLNSGKPAVQPVELRSPYETISYYHFGYGDALSQQQLDDLTDAIDKYKNSDTRDKKTLALGYERIIAHYRGREDKVRHLAREFSAFAELPSQVGVGISIVTRCHDSCRTDQEKIETMRMLKAALETYKGRLSPRELSLLQLRLAEDYYILSEKSKCVEFMNTVAERGVPEHDMPLFQRLWVHAGHPVPRFKTIE